MVLSLKAAGNMTYRGNGLTPERLSLFNEVGINPECAVSCRQIHSKKVFRVDFAPEGELQGDGLITGNRELVLCATAADCMPIYFFDRRTGSFGVVHSGWKGTGIIAEAVGILQKSMDSRLEDITVVMGPSAGSCCYEVDRERYDYFKKNWGPESALERNGSFYLDLEGANRFLLDKIGIENVYSFHQCTICSDKFGSFRREGAEEFTLMLAMIGYFE